MAIAASPKIGMLAVGYYILGYYIIYSETWIKRPRLGQEKAVFE